MEKHRLLKNNIFRPMNFKRLCVFTVSNPINSHSDLHLKHTATSSHLSFRLICLGSTSPTPSIWHAGASEDRSKPAANYFLIASLVPARWLLRCTISTAEMPRRYTLIYYAPQSGNMPDTWRGPTTTCIKTTLLTETLSSRHVET